MKIERIDTNHLQDCRRLAASGQAPFTFCNWCNFEQHAWCENETQLSCKLNSDLQTDAWKPESHATDFYCPRLAPTAHDCEPNALASGELRSLANQNLFVAEHLYPLLAPTAHDCEPNALASGELRSLANQNLFVAEHLYPLLAPTAHDCF